MPFFKVLRGLRPFFGPGSFIMNILIAYLLGIMSALIPKTIKSHTQECENAHKSEKPKPATELKGGGTKIDLSPDEARRYCSEQNKSYNLQKRIFWVNCITLLVLVLYTLFTYRIFSATKKAADAAKNANIVAHDALTRSNRPWLGVESMRIAAPISFIKAGSGKDITYFVNGSLEITIKNFGSSPALSVSNFIEAYEPSFLKEKPDPDDPVAQLRKFGESACAFADGNEFTKKNPRMYGGSIFPTQSTIYNTYGIPGFSKRDLKVGQFLQLVGCISYRDQFGEITHHTHYCAAAPVGVLGIVNNCEANTNAD